MDTMVLLVGDSRRDEDDDCACSHNLTGVRKQVQIDGVQLHAGGEAVKTVSVRLRFQLNLHLNGETKGGNIR